MQASLEEMRGTDVRAVDPDSLMEIGEVTVNTSLPRDARIIDFIERIKNPYCFKCGKTVVKISHADTEATLEDRLEKYLLAL